ncbi:hypothetical protein [Streptomyces sp. t39]|uniref:hypothetical protein n=1 Tax=Streptomyces sp. t39 TaxID=1828156 RepID=UPI0011CE9BE2|nr:hypothetical protein [Streptomyces sp. t39]TXS49921.1 hypothetical protein EAO77_28925 [Streptomyces sp. t39]
MIVCVTPRNDPRRTAAHLVAVWLAGCAVSAVQLQAVLVAVFAGRMPWAAGLLAVVAASAVGLLALLGAHARAVVPLTARGAGPWMWAAAVWALGTLGAAAAAAVGHRVDPLESVLPVHLAGGLCYAVAAALLVPGTRIRLGALGTAAALAAGGVYTAVDASGPPTLDEWITANGVDRAMLMVGEPPPGYTVRVLGASEDGFGADYERAGSPRLHLGVARAGQDRRRADAAGCPVPFGDPIVCTDDGGGRLLVTYGGDHPRRELRLSGGGLVHTVTLGGSGADLAAARRVLSLLRPATDAELAGLTELPMRR